MQGDFKSRKEAAWAVSNICVTGSAEQVHYVAQLGIIEPLIRMLKFLVWLSSLECSCSLLQDARIPMFVLDGLYALLLLGSMSGDGSNHYKDEFEEHDGMRARLCSRLLKRGGRSACC